MSKIKRYFIYFTDFNRNFYQRSALQYNGDIKHRISKIILVIIVRIYPLSSETDNSIGNIKIGVSFKKVI